MGWWLLLALAASCAAQVRYQQGPSQDCIWTWSDWTSCTASCGGGTQTRQVLKIQQQPLGYGAPCPQIGKKDTRACNIDPCPTLPTLPPSQTPPTTGFDCKVRADGNYPAGKCFREYYTCVGGMTIYAQCQKGLIYDPDNDRCDVPYNTQTCTGTPATTKPPMGTSTTQAPEFDCKAQKDGDYPNPSVKCDSKFYTCTNGLTYVRFCAHGLYFDPEILNCEPYWNVPSCSGNPRPTTLSTTTHGPTAPPEFDCASADNGNHAAEKCGAKFYSCHDGTLGIFFCPAGLFYDAERDLCDSYNHVMGCVGSTTPRTTHAPDGTLPPVNFDCDMRDDGYYPNPNEKCSPIYYVCVGGFARELHCPEKLAYSQSEGRCERKDVAFECTGVSPTTRPPQGTFPTFAPVNFDCSDKKNGNYPDPAKKCSHIFYTCDSGIARQLACPTGTYYDPDRDECDFYSNVFVCSGNRPTTTVAAPTTTITVPDFDCSKLLDGVYPDPNSKCSQFFYMCSNGFTSKVSCPANLWFDIDTHVCDAFGNIYACTGTTPKSHTVSIETFPPTPSPPFDCKMKDDGHYPDPMAKCQNFFYVCSNGLTTVQECPAGLYYDVHADACDVWVHVFDCSGQTRPPATTSAPTTPGEPLPIDCSTYADGDYADPLKVCSNVFYTCSNGVTFKRYCPPDTYFDVELNVCDIYADVPKCSGTPRPLSTTTAAPSLAPTTISPYDCTGKASGNYAAGDCESYFYTCVGEIAFKQLCPPGTFFDEETDTCDFRFHLPQCGGHKPTTQPPPAAESTTTKAYPVDCSKLPDGSVPDPKKKCSDVYYLCSNGQTYEKICPKGSVFDISKNMCDYPSKVDACNPSQHRLRVQINKEVDIEKEGDHVAGPVSVSVDKGPIRVEINPGRK